MSSGKSFRRLSVGPLSTACGPRPAKNARRSTAPAGLIIPANIRFITFGFYTYSEQWRPAIAVVVLVGLLVYSQYRRNWKKRLIYIWLAGLVDHGRAHERRYFRPDAGGEHQMGRPAVDASSGGLRLDGRVSAGHRARAGPAVQHAGRQKSVRRLYRADSGVP
jgi:hypothetical protein